MIRYPILTVLCFLLIPSQGMAVITPPANPMVIYVTFFVSSISAINNKKQTFDADFYIIYQWRDPRLKDKKGTEINWKKQWTPLIESINTDNLIKQNLEDVFEINPEGEIKQLLRYKGTFKARFDLSKFPFDRQVLPIALESYNQTFQELTLQYINSDQTFKVTTDKEHAQQVSMKTHLNLDAQPSEWKFRNMYIRQRANHYDFISSDYSQFRIELEVSRKTGFYLWNIILVAILIVIFSWSILFFDREKVSDRLRAVMSLLLSSVAFSMVTASMLPKIPYMTLLDYFMKLNYLMLALIVIESIYVCKLASQGEAGSIKARQLDRRSLIYLPVLYLILVITIWQYMM